MLEKERFALLNEGAFEQSPAGDAGDTADVSGKSRASCTADVSAPLCQALSSAPGASSECDTQGPNFPRVYWSRGGRQIVKQVHKLLVVIF